MQASIQDVPHGITIRTPTSDKTDLWLGSLPFYRFENGLRLGYNPISLQSPSIVPMGSTAESRAGDGYHGEDFSSFRDIITLEGQPGGELTSTRHTLAKVWASGTSVLSALDSVVPKAMVDQSLRRFPFDIQIFTSPLHRQVLCSVANNFAGLDALPIQNIIPFLQKETNEKLYQMVRSARGYTSRAIIQNIFKAAIESGDARIVDLLIRDNPADIRINEQFCIVDGRKYTPIERATMLRYEELVQVFLNHGADVSKIYTRYGAGVLDFAVLESRQNHLHAEIRPQPRVFRILLEAGGDLSNFALTRLMERERELALLFMSKRARKNAAQWCRDGIFCDAMIFFNDQSCMEIINIMLECGLDLNYDVHIYLTHFPAYSYRLMDIAAQRGKLAIVDFLLKSGALLTGNTLPCAARSQNLELITLLLERGADINSIGSLQITTLSVAIGLEDEQMMRFLEERGASVIGQSEWHCFAALFAASEIGNIQLVERFIQSGGRIDPWLLGFVLKRAIKDGRDEIVEKLMEAGANANFRSSVRRAGLGRIADTDDSGPALYEALKRRKESLILSLLDADANPNDMYGSQPILLAAEWGNTSVIKALIFAGVDLNGCNHSTRRPDTALAIAVKRRDSELIELLLASGADVNYGIKIPHIETPLEAAAEIGDIDMAHYLFDQGADPNNPQALEKAYLKNKELFDLICETYHARYPSARGDFGTSVLVRAIRTEDQDVIRQMLQSGFNAGAIMVRDFHTKCKVDFEAESTPLGFAIVWQKEDITENLLQHGCDPNGIVSQVTPTRAKNSWMFPEPSPIRETALLTAIGTQNKSMVELLIKYGARANFLTCGPVKRTPLQRAAELGNMEIVTLLINYGADVNAPAAHRQGGTSLQLAAIGGFVMVACKLLNHKADVNAPGSKVNGKTALERAAEHGRLDMIRVLLNAGAGSRRGDEGQVQFAIDLAREKHFFPICDLLESYLHRRQGHDSGSEIPIDDNDDELGDWNLDEDSFLL